MLKYTVIFCYQVSILQLCPILINQNNQFPSCCRYRRATFLASGMLTVIDPAERRRYLIFRAALLGLSPYNIGIWPASNIKYHQHLARSITVSVLRAIKPALRYREHDGNWLFWCLKIGHKCTTKTFVTKSHVGFKHNRNFKVLLWRVLVAYFINYRIH